MSDVTKIFADNLGDLISKSKPLNVHELAKAIGVSAGALSNYQNDAAAAGIDNLVKIAEYFDVSTDWLLGLSSDPQRIPTATDELGLSFKAVQYLQTLHGLANVPPYDNRIVLLSRLFESRQFDEILALCGLYINLMCKDTDPSYPFSTWYAFHSDELKKHGFVISTPKDQAQMVFSERIVNLLRALLDDIVREQKGAKLQEGDHS